ncbi:hypothetical protein TNCV_1729771 [Trichonephila clavipes]|nr:hypothetical protein TNCV_1729771 [Trichonephila clavipes]
MHLSSQPAFFVHSNVSQHDGKSVPITTFQRDGSDPEVVCITVNHAGLTATAKDIRSDNYTNARLRLVRLLPNSVPFGYLPFCALSLQAAFSFPETGWRLRVPFPRDVQRPAGNQNVSECSVVKTSKRLFVTTVRFGFVIDVPTLAIFMATGGF